MKERFLLAVAIFVAYYAITDWDFDGELGLTYKRKL